MALTVGSQNSVFGGMIEATDFLDHRCPFQCATFLPPTAQMLWADRALPLFRLCPDETFFQLVPLKCRAPRPEPGAPKAQTLRLLSTTVLPTSPLNDPSAAQVVPFHRNACDWPPSWVNAQTLRADEPPAARTVSSAWSGKATWCQPAAGVRCQAAGADDPSPGLSKAHACCVPVAAMAVNAGSSDADGVSTVCQD